MVKRRPARQGRKRRKGHRCPRKRDRVPPNLPVGEGHDQDGGQGHDRGRGQVVLDQVQVVLVPILTLIVAVTHTSSSTAMAAMVAAVGRVKGKEEKETGMAVAEAVVVEAVVVAVMRAATDRDPATGKRRSEEWQASKWTTLVKPPMILVSKLSLGQQCQCHGHRKTMAQSLLDFETQ